MRLQFGYSLIAIAVMAAIMTPRQVVATSLSSSPANEDNLTFDPIFLNTSGEEKSIYRALKMAAPPRPEHGQRIFSLTVNQSLRARFYLPSRRIKKCARVSLPA